MAEETSTASSGSDSRPRASDAAAGPAVPSPRGRSVSLSMPELSPELFDRFAEVVDRELGIKMPPAKRTMLAARLRKRLRDLGLDTYEQYAEYVIGERHADADELIHMIDVVTTNKTDFFREPRHFDYLSNVVLPAFRAERPGGRLMLWSAGCSTGEEPYTLAMVLSEFADRHEGFDFQILATDVSTRVLAAASDAIYTARQAAPIPEGLKKKYLLRSKNRDKELVRMVKKIRDRVSFARVNLLEDDYRVETPMDAIFFRNVLIYFDRPRQEAIINRLAAHLKPGGYFFISHAETMLGLNTPLNLVGSSVYRR